MLCVVPPVIQPNISQLNAVELLVRQLSNSVPRLNQKTGLISDLISQLPMFTLIIMHDIQVSGRISLSCLQPENGVCARLHGNLRAGRS